MKAQNNGNNRNLRCRRPSCGLSLWRSITHIGRTLERGGLMERSAFFNSVAGDRKYKAEIFAGYFSKFITNGIFPLPADNLRIAAYDRIEIKAHKGTGYIYGYLYENTDT